MSPASIPRGALSRFRGGESRPEQAVTGDPADPDPDSDEVDSLSLARVRVEEAGIQRPFMRGILVHSLTEQGLSFEDAYRIAQSVWRRVRERAVVSKTELAEIVEELTLADELERGAESAGTARRSWSIDEPITVLGKDGRWPFNQARLQQSLLAAGLEPLAAFETTVEIERGLRFRREGETSRDRLRDLVADTLRERRSARAADRYLAWRSYQNDDERPLILLLGGTSGVGKSSLALEVARRLGIGRVLSTDSIRDVMRMMLSDELVPTLHVSSFEAHTRLVSKVGEGLDPIVEGFLDQSRTVSVGVRAVIERGIVEGTSTILDGVSLVPGLIDPTVWQDRAHTFFLLAADEDRESLYSHLVARAHGKGARASERYVRNFEGISTIQEALLERAEMYGVPVIDVQDREGAALNVVKHVVGRLGERRAAEASRLD